MIVKPTTIRLILSLAISKGGISRQLDDSNQDVFTAKNLLALFIRNIQGMSASYKRLFMDFVKLQEPERGSNDWEMMSTVAAPSGATGKSMLNPNAPLFIPMAFQQVEDSSAEWWELVKTTTWFREHWLRQRQDQETFDADEDVTNLLPDSFDLGVGDESSILEAEHDDAAGDQISTALKKERIGNGIPSGAEAVARSLG
ncbi:polyadenylate-binding protein-interacting protein [Musa troglodytarum]|uniref:Polyadenylate-binding protein-interacting protein n=1 Tax=Musa troglodytarum TaxID=320322 RepID=A0A9E7L4C5_9LILI|nr:polyadenylate-binding protein-interacting protein [Musa troglodytarum]